jgi:hypothetical protein
VLNAVASGILNNNPEFTEDYNGYSVIKLRIPDTVYGHHFYISRSSKHLASDPASEFAEPTITKVVTSEDVVENNVYYSNEDGIFTETHVYSNGDSEYDSSSRELDLKDVSKLIDEIRSSTPFIEKTTEPSSKSRFMRSLLN